MSVPENPLEDLYRARDLLQAAAAGLRATPPVERGPLRPYDMAIAGVLDGLFAAVDELASESENTGVAEEDTVRGALDTAIAAAHSDSNVSRLPPRS